VISYLVQTLVKLAVSRRTVQSVEANLSVAGRTQKSLLNLGLSSVGVFPIHFSTCRAIKLSSVVYFMLSE
jgi:hypothetical protein